MLLPILAAVLAATLVLCFIEYAHKPNVVSLIEAWCFAAGVAVCVVRAFG